MVALCGVIGALRVCRVSCVSSGWGFSLALVATCYRGLRLLAVVTSLLSSGACGFGRGKKRLMVLVVATAGFFLGQLKHRGTGSSSSRRAGAGRIWHVATAKKPRQRKKEETKGATREDEM